MKLLSPGAILLILCLSSIAMESVSAEKPWMRYENPHFTAYSNASEKETRRLLEDLETFRAAFIQVSNVEVPASAPKPVVLIMGKGKAYQKVAPGKYVAGFALKAEGRTFIVMPATGGRKWSSTVIRHEYGHILLSYKNFRYPGWYSEGFCELVSSMELTNKGKSFLIGQVPDRAKRPGPPLIPWDELVSYEFNPHTMTNLALVSSAYAQAWLLAHYTTLGDFGKNARNLQKYFDLLKEGGDSVSAFEEAFGIAPEDLWASALEAYTHRVPGYTFAFRPGAVQSEFSPVSADAAEILPIMEYLEFRSRAGQASGVPKDPLAALQGSWAQLSLEGTCDSSTRISVNGSAATITIETDSPGDADPDVTTYGLESAGNGEYSLTLPDAPADDVPDDTLGLSVLADDLFCLGPGEGGRESCAVLMRKCGD